MRSALLAACCVSLLASSAGAQTVRGRVTIGDSLTIPGVLVLLVDDADRVVARALSDGRGEYRLAAPAAGALWIRAMRIGFRTASPERIDLVAGQDLVRDLPLRVVAFAMDTVRVRQRARCAAPAATPDVAAVWEQARIVLDAAQVTAGNAALAASMLRQERAVDARKRNERVISPVRRETGFTSRGWTSLSTDSLHRGGYVHRLRDGTLSWYAPDIDVLRSDQFVADHCFRLTRTNGAIGVEFEPVSDRRDVAEIAGTVWLDLQTAELRHLDYRYVNVPGVERGDPGGDMRFVRLANGGWAIERWSIRMPVFAEHQRPGNGVPGEAPQKVRVHVETRIASGELALVMQGSDTLYAAGIATSGPRSIAIREPITGTPAETTLANATAVRDTVTPVRIATVTSAAAPFRHEFDIRSTTGPGKFLTREDFLKHPARTLPDFMAEIPGARLARASGQVWVTSGRGATATLRSPPPGSVLARAEPRRACYVDVWLDGVMVYGRGPNDPLFDIATIPTGSIHGLEFYASGALTPAQYQRYGAECGTLLIWTRRP